MRNSEYSANEYLQNNVINQSYKLGKPTHKLRSKSLFQRFINWILGN